MSDYSGYKIKRAHALGAFASVHEATAPDGGPGRFALKIFHPPPSTNIRRSYAIEGWLFAAERQRDKAKKDGAVLPVLACGLCPEGAYAVMPWQEHSLEPLVANLAAKGDHLRALAECLLNTLEQWEAQTGGSHRKLKASNIFLHRSGPLEGMTAMFSDPWFMYGDKQDTSRTNDLSAIGAILAQVVRRREVAAWPIEDAPEWKALHHPGKAWLAFCNYLLNPQPAAGELTNTEARKRLRAIPKDARPVRNALLIGAAAVLVIAGGVLAFARFGDPAIMPDQMVKLAEKVHNPLTRRETPSPYWAPLCRAWDTWLGDLQGNAARLLRTEGLWSGPNDPLRVSLQKFVAEANRLQPAALVPEAAGEKRMAVLADAQPTTLPALYQALLIVTTQERIATAYNGGTMREDGTEIQGVQKLSLQLERWQRWDEMRELLARIEAQGFTRAAAALQPRLPPKPASDGYKLDMVRTLKFFNDLSLDDTGALLLAKSWSELTRLKADMEGSNDRVQKAMPDLILARLVDRSSLGDFADSLADPLEEMRRRRQLFLAPSVVRERFLKESDLLNKETAAVTADDFPRWEQELVQFSKVPAAEDPRLAAGLDASVRQLPQTAVDLEADAPEAEPGGLPTLSAPDFKKEFDGVNANLKALRGQEIVRHDLPRVSKETSALADAFRLLERRIETTLALLNPATWLDKARQPYGNFAETRRRWAAWQATISGVTAADLTRDRNRFRALRAQVRQVKDWIDGLEGPDGLAALAVPDLAALTPDTVASLRQLEAARREDTAAAAAGAVEWRAALPQTTWAAAGAAVRAPLQAHRDWLAALPAFGVDLDRLGALLADGFGWNEGVSEVMEKLARHPGLDVLAGRPAEWNTEAKLLQKLTGSGDRAELVAAAQSGGLSRKLTAWRRLGTLAGWPANASDLDVDGAVVARLREDLGRDVKDETRRGNLVGELTRETRVRWNRAARNSVSDEKQVTAVFERMERYGIGEADLEAPALYNLKLWQLKRADWSEVDLAPLKARRDTFVQAVQTIPGMTAQPAVKKFTDELANIDLVVDPNHKPTPSPRLAGWHEDLIDDGLGLTAMWTSGNRTLKLDFAVVQPEGTPPFYLAKRALAVGEFVDLMNSRPNDAAEVMKELPPWAQTGKGFPYDQPMAWWRNPDTDRLEVSPAWLNYKSPLVKGLFDDKNPAVGQAAAESPTVRSPLQLIPPVAAKIFLERILGARLPTVREWEALMKTVPPPATGIFRGDNFQKLFAFLRDYNVSGARQIWRPNSGAFQLRIPSPAGSPPAADEGRAVERTASTRLWLSPVDEGPAAGGFVNLTGNVWIYLQGERPDQFYAAGGSAFSVPEVDPTKAYRIDPGKLAIGAKKVSEGFTDIGIRPAFDAPPGFRERYKLLLLVRQQAFLTW